MKKYSAYKKLLVYLKPYYGRFALGIFLALILSVANGATAWVVKPLLDEVLVKKDLYLLGLMPWILILIFSIKGITRFFQAYIMRDIGQKIIARIRQDLYEHLLKMPLCFYKKYMQQCLCPEQPMI